MTPEISEFSYGFALTNEIVGWAPVAAAPLFPSLIEEGKAGGGYDVALNLSGVALYLQFKRADCMVRATAREIRDHALRLALPFYRFKITESGKSDQHELLLALDETDNLVFYAAPRFHQLDEINDAWNHNRVAARSIFVRPSLIGDLDEKSHHIAYDNAHAWLCSDPKNIDFSNAGQLVENIQDRLKKDSRSLRADGQTKQWNFSVLDLAHKMSAIFLSGQKYNCVAFEIDFGAQLLQHALRPLLDLSITLGIERFLVRLKALLQRYQSILGGENIDGIRF
jgi:hypothetical protein